MFKVVAIIKLLMSNNVSAEQPLGKQASFASSSAFKGVLNIRRSTVNKSGLATLYKIVNI